MSTDRRGRLRVTIVAQEVHEHGGTEGAAAQLIQRAVDTCDVTVVASHLGDDLRGRVQWRRVPAPSRPPVVRMLGFAVRAAAAVRRTPADVVHTMGAIVPNRADLATVHYCHSCAPADARTAGDARRGARAVLSRMHARVLRQVSRAAERWCYRPSRLRRAAAVSPGGAREFARAFPGVPVSVTPNGVDLARFAPDASTRARVRREAGVDDDEVVALFVGGDWVRKGLGIAIEAVGHLARDGARVRLWVVGVGDAARYGEQARDEGIGDRVTFFGFRHDRERFFQGADVFVLPSVYETFALAAFEAAAAELPLVVTSVNDVGALVRDGSGGAVVERDPKAVAAALLPYVTDAQRRAIDGRAARARVQPFTWDASAESVLELYRELAGVGASES
jgi:glycosyltransferase involved in cell wall biosynthesis